MPLFIPRIGLMPAFPEYTGPYKVGTVDVELPVSEFESPSPAPDESISTVQYRIFYPCEPDAKSKNISWLPAPQRGYISAYTKFLGAGSRLADFISYLPNHLSYISIPVLENAPLLSPTTENKRWPVMFFSHGLGGSRNAYSQLVGSVASHGVIVIAPEHRDGSTPVSYIRDVPSNNSSSEKSAAKKSKRAVSYMRLSHTPTPEVEAGRNTQLKVRLWELGVIHESVLELDRGTTKTNLNTSATSLSIFKNLMDVHEAGKITFAGHSFGAATITQFVKSTFYAPRTSEAPASYTPLFTPSSRSAISAQINPRTPIILLDVWCLPLRAAATRWLWNLPFPSYSTPTSPGGSTLLAVESDAFYKWRVHLKATKRLLSPDPSSLAYDYTTKDGETTWPEPHFYYASTSAHLSQSDFGILFPWVTKKMFGCEEPERIMRLNIRAILQLLRSNQVPISTTSPQDMELDLKSAQPIEDDKAIFGRNGEVKGWDFITTNLEDLSDVDDEAEAQGEVEKSDVTEPSQAVVGNELLKQQEGTTEQLTTN